MPPSRCARDHRAPPPCRTSRASSACATTAAGRGDHARIEMAASLLCTDSVDEARTIDTGFIDVRAWIETPRLDPQPGYVAPPLDGIWATAPFFHNGSVPTIEAVLDSSKRPTYWVRTSYDSTDYDPVAVGWNFTAITHGQAMEPTETARVKIYDTTLDGYHNTGHPNGDALTTDERQAVIEYLKTL